MIPRLVVVALATLSCVAARAGELGESAADPSAFATVIDARQYDDRFTTVQELLDQAPGVRVQSLRRARLVQHRVDPRGEARAGAGAAGRRAAEQRRARRVRSVDAARAPDRAHRGAARRRRAALRQRRRRRGHLDHDAPARGEPASPRSTRRSPRAATRRTAAICSVSGANDSANGLASYSRLRSTNDFDFDAARAGALPVAAAATGGAVPPAEPTTHTRLNARLRRGLGPAARRPRARPAARGSTARSTCTARTAASRAASGPSRRSRSDEELSCTLPEQSQQRGVARLALDRRRARPRGPLRRARARRERAQRERQAARPGQRLSARLGARHRQRRRRRGRSAAPRSTAPGACRELAWFDGALALRRAQRREPALRHGEPVGRRPAATHDGVGLAAARARAVRDGTLRLFPALAWEHASTSEGLTRSAAFQPLVAVRAARRDRLAAGDRRDPRRSRRACASRRTGSACSGGRPSPSCSTPTGARSAATRRCSPRRAGTPTRASSWRHRAPASCASCSLEADVFQRELDQGIEWLFNTNRAFMPVNIGPARVLGAEVAAGAIFFEVLSLDASYTYSDARFLGNGAAAAAFDAASSAASRTCPRTRSRARPRSSSGPVRLFARRALRERDLLLRSAASSASPATTQVDAGITLRARAQIPGLDFFPERLSLTVEGLNLTGEQRSDSLGAAAAQGSASGWCACAEPRREPGRRAARGHAHRRRAVERHARALHLVPARARDAPDQRGPRLRRHLEQRPGRVPAADRAGAGARLRRARPTCSPAASTAASRRRSTCPTSAASRSSATAAETRGWLTTSSCELAVPFDYATGAG